MAEAAHGGGCGSHLPPGAHASHGHLDGVPVLVLQPLADPVQIRQSPPARLDVTRARHAVTFALFSQRLLHRLSTKASRVRGHASEVTCEVTCHGVQTADRLLSCGELEREVEARGRRVAGATVLYPAPAS